MECSANIAEVCGGSGRINIFLHTSPVQVDPPGAWSSLGCYTFVVHDVVECQLMCNRSATLAYPARFALQPTPVFGTCHFNYAPNFAPLEGTSMLVLKTEW